MRNTAERVTRTRIGDASSRIADDALFDVLAAGTKAQKDANRTHDSQQRALGVLRSLEEINEGGDGRDHDDADDSDGEKVSAVSMIETTTATTSAAYNFLSGLVSDDTGNNGVKSPPTGTTLMRCPTSWTSSPPHLAGSTSSAVVG